MTDTCDFGAPAICDTTGVAGFTGAGTGMEVADLGAAGFSASTFTAVASFVTPATDAAAGEAAAFSRDARKDVACAASTLRG